MSNNYSESSLDAAILALEKQQKAEALLLKTEFYQAVDSLRPINLIKSTFQQVTHSGELKGDFVNTAVALGAGFVSKKAYVGFSHSPLRKMIGTAIMFGVTNLVAKNPIAVKMATLGVLKLLKRKPAEKPAENGSLDHIGSSFYLK